MKVYLAGPISGLTYFECTDWRNYVARMLEPHGIRAVSPMRGKKQLAGEGKIPRYVNEERRSSTTTPKAITTRDRNDVTTADAVLMNLLHADRISVGSMIEVGWADAFRVPVVLVMEPFNRHDHPILTQCAGFIVPTLDEGIEVVKSLLLPDDEPPPACSISLFRTCED